MKTIKFLFFGALAMLFLTTGCEDNFIIRGNGIEVTEGRIAQDFDKVKSSGDFEVHITKGDEYEVVVTAEQNVIHYIGTSVSGSTLNIDIRGLHNVKNRLPMEVYITTPHLKGIKQSGSGIVTTDYFNADLFVVSLSGSGFIKAAVDAVKVNASISGSGKLDLSGVANEASFDISGSGKIDSYSLFLQNCMAKISGSGDMRINAEQKIHASISGSGNIFYIGNPNIETHISGSGNLIHEN